MFNYDEGMIPYPNPKPLPETQKLFLQCMENFIRERQQEAVKKFWEEIADCLDLPITEDSAVIVLDKKKVDEAKKSNNFKLSQNLLTGEQIPGSIGFPANRVKDARVFSDYSPSIGLWEL